MDQIVLDHLIAKVHAFHEFLVKGKRPPVLEPPRPPDLSDDYILHDHNF